MTRMIVTLLILGAGLALPTASRAQSASDVIDRVIEAETANYAGIERLFKLSRTMGHPVPEYMERQDGQLITVPISELFGEQQPNALSDAPPEALRDAAAILGYESTTVDAAMEQEMASAGLTGGIGSALLMASNPDEPWLTGSPGGMMRLYADWLNAAADSKEAIAAERVKDAAEAERNLEALEAAKARTRIIGNSMFDGMNVIEIGADNLGIVQQTEDGTFTTETLRMSVHADRYLPVRFRIEGTLRQGNDTRRMTIERIDSHFTSNIPGCANLFLPRGSTMRLGNVLTPKEEKELAEAQVQMAELDKQLASMPQAQKDMMMQMMGPQLEMIKKMAATGGIEVETEILEIRCNDDMPEAKDVARMLY